MTLAEKMPNTFLSATYMVTIATIILSHLYATVILKLSTSLCIIFDSILNCPVCI